MSLGQLRCHIVAKVVGQQLLPRHCQLIERVFIRAKQLLILLKVLLQFLLARAVDVGRFCRHLSGDNFVQCADTD